tara:strand:+ start:3122 stop:3919 length:798 start_codon:yes stop_codon:yes gene_type:complete
MRPLLLITILALFLGVYYCVTSDPSKLKEPFTHHGIEKKLGFGKSKCPDVLIQKGDKVFLYNSTKPKVPGANPIVFNNLEEYVEYTKWQRDNNIKCPVLSLRETHDIQGGMSYKATTDEEDPQWPTQQDQDSECCSASSASKNDLAGGLIGVNDDPYFKCGGEVTGTKALNTGPIKTKLVDATRNDPPYNVGNVPSFDPSSFYEGTKTPLDKMLSDQRKLKESPSAMDPNWGGIEYTNSLIDKGYYDGRRRKSPSQTILRKKSDN